MPMKLDVSFTSIGVCTLSDNAPVSAERKVGGNHPQTRDSARCITIGETGEISD